MNRIDRLMGITLLLQGRRLTRAEDIAQRFEISLRTVYRDVAALSELGVPIMAEAGVGYRLMKGYNLPPIMFTEEEAAALGMAALALRRTSDPSLEASIETALLKVKVALPSLHRDRLERIERSVAFGCGSKSGEAESRVARLVDIQRCLMEARTLRIQYRAPLRGEGQTRVVEPLGLIHYLDRWHLIAWCRLRDDVRDFRLDRIEKLEILSEKVLSPRPFSLDEYLSRQREMEAPILVKALFRPQSVDRAKREWSMGLLDEAVVEGGSLLTLSTGKLEWMIGWLLSFRERVRVIEPVELRQALADEARRLWQWHASDQQDPEAAPVDLSVDVAVRPTSSASLPEQTAG